MAQIPIVDIFGPDSEESIADQLVRAATVHGFVYVRSLGKGILIKDIDRAFDLSKKFFASPIEEKQKVAITESNHGWVAMHSETLDSKNQRIGDFKEAFNIGEFTNNHAQQPLPPSLAPHETELSTFFTTCHALCLRILTLLGHGLHIPASAGGSTWFTTRHLSSHGHRPSGCTLRLLYYPSIAADSDYDPEVDIRAGAHSDYGSITLLFQRPGQPGLEILSSRRGEDEDKVEKWTPVPVSPSGTESDPSPPILVNIGDLFEFWTNGLFRSVVHRVVFPKGDEGAAQSRDGGGGGGAEDRYSIAFFCHPVDDTPLESVPSEMVSTRKAPQAFGHGNGAGVGAREQGGKVITAKEHLLQRLKATYLGLYEKERGEGQ